MAYQPISTVFGTASLILGTQADNLANTTDTLLTSSLLYVYDGATWDRLKGDSTDGVLVNLGSNNDVTVTSGSITATQGTAANLNATVVGTGTFLVQAAQSGNWSVRLNDGSGNSISSTSNALHTLVQNASIAVTKSGTWDITNAGTFLVQESGGGFISTNNSSTATLGGGAVFTGTADEITNYSSISVYVISNVASATDGLAMQQSNDGTNWDNIDVYTVAAATGKTFGAQCTARYFRVVYTNGAGAQASFRLQTIYHRYMQRNSTVRPQDARSNENDFSENLAFLMGFNGTTWDRVRTVGTGILKVANNDGAGNALTSNSTTYTAKFGLDVNILGTLGTAFSTAGKIDIKGADGDVFVRQATASNLNATVVGTGTFVVQDNQVLADNAQFTDGTTKLFMGGYIFDETAGTALTENDGAAARINANRAQISVLEDPTTRGRYATVTASNALKVDASGVAVPVTDNSGSLTVDAPVGTPVFATITPSTSGGWSVFNATSGDGSTALTNSAQSVKGSAGTLGGWYIFNPNTSTAYVVIYNVASGSVTVGTTTPAMVLAIPAGSAANLELANGIQFGTAISIAAASTAAGNGAPSTALDVNIFYK